MEARGSKYPISYFDSADFGYMTIRDSKRIKREVLLFSRAYRKYIKKRLAKLKCNKNII